MLYIFVYCRFMTVYLSKIVHMIVYMIVYSTTQYYLIAIWDRLGTSWSVICGQKKSTVIFLFLMTSYIDENF